MKRHIAFFAALALTGALIFALGTEPSAPSQATTVAASPSATDLYAAGYKASKAEHYEEAIADFRKAIAIKADYAEAWNMLGFCLRKTGNVTEAFASYEKAIKLKPNFPEAREYYGEAFLISGNIKDALRQYVVLEKSKRPEAKELLEKIDAFLKANPGA
jgi:Flp pilus assembly protein TadD